MVKESMAYIQCGPTDHITCLPSGVAIVCPDRENVPAWVTEMFEKEIAERASSTRS